MTKSVFHRANRNEKRASTWNKLIDTASAATYSGKRVDEEKALKFSVVWAAATLIADAIAYLTPEAYVLGEDGSVEVKPCPRWVLRPHPELRRGDVWSQMLLSVLLWGNGYAMLVKRDSDAQIIGMIPLDPRAVHCEWNPDKPSHKRYQISGRPANEWLTSGDILHITGPTLPGSATGMSVIAQARESIALGLTLEEFAARYFGQGSMAKVVLKIPGELREKQALDIVKTYERFHKGADNWHRPAVLSGGGDIENISIPPEDAQFLQSREFQALDVARWFRVPPHVVGIMTKQSSWGSGLAEENMAMVQRTYRPWIRRFEDVLTAYLPFGEDAGVRIRLQDSELLRGTFKEMVEAWGTAVEKKLATPNEARKPLGLPPIEGGDELVEPPDPFGGGGGQDPKATPGKPGKRYNKYHAKDGTFTSSGLPVVSSIADLSPEQQAMVDANLENFGITQADLVAEIDSRLTDDLMAQGADWYPSANKLAVRMAEEHGLTVDQTAGMLAALSPHTPWPQNEKLGLKVAAEFRTGEHIGGGLSANINNATAIARGTPVSDVVKGTKVRSFNNNIRYPGQTNDVTVDTWMFQAFMNTSPKVAGLGPKDKGAIKMAEQFRDGKGLPRSMGVKGSLQPGYISIADAVRTVAAKRGVSPDVIQAAYWTYAKTTRTGGRKPRGAS